MSATNLIVEYLVAGTLMIVAISAAAVSWSPDGLQSVLELLEQASALENGAVISTVVEIFASGVSGCCIGAETAV